MIRLGLQDLAQLAHPQKRLGDGFLTNSPDFSDNAERSLQLVDREVLAALRQHGHDPLEQRRQVLVAATENDVQQEVENGADLCDWCFGDADVVNGDFVALVDADVELRRFFEQVGAELPDVVRGKPASEQNGDLKKYLEDYSN